MPNGRNAGRLFADCENEYGYGESHKVVCLDGSIPPDRPPVPVEVVCVGCQRRFMLDADGLHLMMGTVTGEWKLREDPWMRAGMIVYGGALVALLVLWKRRRNA